MTMHLRRDTLVFASYFAAISWIIASLVVGPIYGVIVGVLSFAISALQWWWWVARENTPLVDQALGASLFAGVLSQAVPVFTISCVRSLWSAIGPGARIGYEAEGFGSAVALIFLCLVGVAEGVVGLAIGWAVYRFVRPAEP
jgi:hypothetical protein